MGLEEIVGADPSSIGQGALPTAWECGIRNSTISEDDAEIAQVEDEKVMVKGDARNPER